MRADVSSAEVIRETFLLGTELDRRDAPIRRIAECVGRIRPRILTSAEDYDDRCLIWALTAIATHLAIEAGDTLAVAALFRSNARLLDLVPETSIGRTELAP